MRRWLLVLAWLALATPAGANVDPTPLRAQVADPPAFIRAEAGMERAVSAVQELWPAAAGAVAQGLGHERIRPVEVVLLSGNTFRRWSRGLLPEWGAGYASWPNGPIVLDVSAVSRGPKGLDSILRHEISHVYLGQALDGVRPPRWFVEGVAQAQSGEWRFSDTVGLVASASTDRLPQLSELGRDFPQGGGRASLAYRISLRAVLELDRRFGERGGWRAVLEPTRAGGRFDLAFEQTYGLRLPTFESEVHSRLNSRYGWIAALAGAGSLFTAMTVLFLAGYARKRYQVARRLREMEAEERESDALSGDDASA